MIIKTARKKYRLQTIHAFLFVLVTTFLCTPSVALSRQQQTLDVQVVPVETVLRLLDSDFWDVQQLILDQLPNDLPVQVPLPDQSVVLATVIYRITDTEANFYRVLIEVPHPSDVVIAQYQNQLENLGWKLPTFMEDGSSGFIPTFDFRDSQRTVCKADETHSFSILATPLADNVTSLDITVFDNTANPGCITPAIGGELLEVGPMPLLRTPSGARVSLTGSGSSQGGNFSTATVGAIVESDLSASAIARHYATQWEMAGWRLLNSEESVDTIQSFWTLEDNTGNLWAGTFTLVPSAERPGTFNLEATIESVEPEP